MIGCHARALENAALDIDRTEIEDARWFAPEEVSLMMQGIHPDGLYVPPRQALANTLMTVWLASIEAAGREA